MIFSSVFGIFIGIGMIGQWGMLYFTKQIPEIKTEPIRLLFHLAAEFTTAIMLIIGGIAILFHYDWASTVYLLGIGMLFYTAIVSPGYFAQQGEWKWCFLFGGILLGGVFSILFLF